MPKVGRRKRTRAITPRYLVSWAERLIGLMRERGAETLSLRHADGHAIELRLGEPPPDTLGDAAPEPATLSEPAEPDDGRLRTSWGQ